MSPPIGGRHVLAVALVERMTFVFGSGLQVGDVLSDQYYRELSKISAVTPIRDPTQFPPVTTQGRSRFSFGVARDKILFG